MMQTPELMTIDGKEVFALRCYACAEWRPKDKISIEFNPNGKLLQNFQYCNDKDYCKHEANEFSKH